MFGRRRFVVLSLAPVSVARKANSDETVVRTDMVVSLVPASTFITTSPGWGYGPVAR